MGSNHETADGFVDIVTCPTVLLPIFGGQQAFNEWLFTMPRPFPAEFRLRVVALVRAGKTITRTAEELGVSQAALHGWVRQDKIDRGEIPAASTKGNAELKKAMRRIRELEMEV